MGLDMYLKAKKYLFEFDEDEKKKADTIRALFPEMFLSDNLNSVEVSFEVGYWRKANAIHKWFVDNVQEGVDECQNAYVCREDLEKLLSTCKEVIENKKETENKLPTQEGFFFGNTNYDVWYFRDIEHTIKVIEQCLKLPDDYSFEYRASW